MMARFRYGDEILRGEVIGSSIEAEGVEYRLEEVELLAPSDPSKVICVGLNYVEHAEELKMDLPAEPIIFLKPPTAVIGPGADIVMPPSSRQVDYEGELAVVIKERCRCVSARKADDYVLGYANFNDVTARDLQRRDGQWTRAKSFDTFAPLGPFITEADPSSLKIETRVNGVLRQKSSTSDLIFSVPELIEFVSGIMTLLPGDVIASGTPPGVGSLSAGDEVEVEIEGLGTLRNGVVAGS
ncbi:fumarylacetoacetate hydrolase family protein [Methanocrinis sp.]|uniref:fumarylacetoacetate hydrolase family protein n=1 Tax=Methanocrinis sp. TaxID=3101522 RepID=UPI003D0A97EF